MLTRRRVAAVVILAAGASACSGPSSMLDPRGAGARRVAGLWWMLFWIAAVVLVIVLGLMAYSIVRHRPADIEGEAPTEVPGWGHPFVVISGFAVPVVILLIVFGISLGDLQALNRTDVSTDTSVEVVGHMWWWEARYPNGAVTANEIHIPVAEPVRFVLTSADVIHSFWVPNLHPKRDMVPGRENVIILEADEPGRYRGICAEFCGLQHANMALYIVADPDFDQWVAQQAESANPPAQADADGKQVFLGSTCFGCHTIRGTAANATVGPDLTHLATRRTLFAGRLDNNRENLRSIILDPQSVKPGTVMPPTKLEPGDLNALLDYLEGMG